MANKYENVVNKFNENNCKLLNTKEDYIKIVKLSQNGKYKLNYIASCGHEHIVLYYSSLVLCCALLRRHF